MLWLINYKCKLYGAVSALRASTRQQRRLLCWTTYLTLEGKEKVQYWFHIVQYGKEKVQFLFRKSSVFNKICLIVRCLGFCFDMIE